MKRSQAPKKPTRRQKIAIQKAGLVWKNWRVKEDTGEHLVIVSGSGQRREIPV